ncbi:MAG: DUF4054 domain-containing protein [Prevotella sp.]|nr:DUF4054 domain-containing protein [Prevotella sp.]
MDEVLKVFRVIAPEFNNLTDEEVTAMLELFAPMVSKNTFGTKYNLALAYFVAHIIALNGVYATAQGSSTDGSVAGIKREKEGDLEREYAIPDASDYMSLLYKTYYGRMYLQIMKLCAIGIKTRFG